jgi:hypothetical protein
MNQNGSVLLLVVLVVVVLLIVAAALSFAPINTAPGGGTPGGRALSVSGTLVRNPGGVSAVITITNPGPQELRDFRFTKLSVPGMTGGPAQPYVVGRVQEGGSVSVTFPFTGPAPAPGAALQIQLDYDYRSGWFRNGAGSSSVTSIVP